MPRHISRDAARRFLVKRHLLAPPRSLPPSADSVMAVVAQLGSLQFDPLEVAGRNHDLVLAARIAGYRRELTDELLYGSRRLFETYNKALNLLPTSELPFYRISWDRTDHGRIGELLARQAPLRDRILEEIQTGGPRSSLDFEREAAVDWWWGPTTAVRAVLEGLYVSGVLGVSRRDGNRRYYDLTERLYPPELLAERPAERDQLRHKLLSRYRAHGLLGTTGSGELWVTTGKTPLRTELRHELLDMGALLPVTVEGIRGERFVVATEAPLLDAAERGESAGGDGPAGGEAAGETPEVSFLAPLDPLMWDRALLKPLWDFDYVWEVYTPIEKRRWGYYVLPLLFGERLVGRIEPRFDRRSKTLRILGLSFEPGFEPLAEPGFAEAFVRAVAAYMEFGGVDTLERSGSVVAAANRPLFRQVLPLLPRAPRARRPGPRSVPAASLRSGAGMRASTP